MHHALIEARAAGMSDKIPMLCSPALQPLPPLTAIHTIYTNEPTVDLINPVGASINVCSTAVVINYLLYTTPTAQVGHGAGHTNDSLIIGAGMNCSWDAPLR
jgi:hypothetical protein